MVKYTESELIDLRTTAVVPSAVDFLAFTKAIEEQRAQSDAEATTTRRRSSVQGSRPKFQFAKKPREKKEAPKPDEEGWVTLTNKKKSSFGAEDGQQQKDTFKSQIKDQSVNKIRANSKKMSSSSAGGASDLLAEKPKSKFNAFAALNSDDDEE